MPIKKKKVYVLIFLFTLIPNIVKAHCPLCTIGIGTAALGATWLGVSSISIGIMVGAFATVLGLWIDRITKRRVISGQKYIIVILSFLTTILPIQPLFKDYFSIYFASWGQYGRVFAINKFVLGSIVGGIILFIAPLLNRYIIKLRQNKSFPFQRIIVNFILLILTAIIFELIS